MKEQVWNRYHTWIAGGISGLLVVICYEYALRLPFFYDDLPIMTWLSRHDWIDIWTLASENAYYRPLAFTIYKAGQLFPPGTRQVILHTTSVLIHWINTLLIMQVVKICDNSPRRGLLAAMLFALFPFLFLSIPWITALSHPLVAMLTLLATYAALRAERENSTRWWGISLSATALAPFAHESGPMCSVIVAGVVIIQHGLRAGHRRLIGITLGVMLNVGAVLLRNYIPDVGATQFTGLNDWPQNTMFFLHGLLYPVGPVIGWLVQEQNWHDLSLVGVATVSFVILLVWLARKSQDWRWIPRYLWWWACGALPGLVSLKYGGLFTSPRLHTLASAGVVMLWANIIFELGQMVRNARGRRMVWSLLAGVIILQNVAFLRHQRRLFTSLNHVYQPLLEAAQDTGNASFGFVNLPTWLAWRSKTYTLISEGVLFIPDYSNVAEFIEVNVGPRTADNVMYAPVIQATEQVARGFHGAGLDWEQMRQFAIDHRTVWLTRNKNEQFELEHVGTITAGALPSLTEPLVRFENGPVIESAAVQKTQSGAWTVALTWLASGPVDGEIFVHVRDANNNVVTQADGPALGGMVPIWLWRSGDRIFDVRHITLPDGTGPYTVQVGIYNAQGRFPAFKDNVRCQDDTAPVAVIAP
jgi:hypothetical protein